METTPNPQWVVADTSSGQYWIMLRQRAEEELSSLSRNCGKPSYVATSFCLFAYFGQYLKDLFYCILFEA